MGNDINKNDKSNNTIPVTPYMYKKNNFLEIIV